MSGQPGWGFLAFDRAADRLRACLGGFGVVVVSPADLDRAAGFDGCVDVLPDGFLAAAMRRDLEALLTVDAVVLLPGWQLSAGTAFELLVADALALDVWLFVELGAGWRLERRSV